MRRAISSCSQGLCEGLRCCQRAAAWGAMGTWLGGALAGAEAVMAAGCWGWRWALRWV